jgi:hypothetical protein
MITLTDLQNRFGAALHGGSFVLGDHSAMWLHRTSAGKRLAVLARPDSPLLATFHGAGEAFSTDYRLLLCPLDHTNARALRLAVPQLQPVPLGLSTSAGFGDRLGLATPGHVHALRHVHAELAAPGKTIAPIFAQQSIREMTRTGRSPDDVLTDATWGAFEAGWRGPVGADADHLKTLADIDACAAAGFSFFTIDPGAHVVSQAESAPASEIERQAAALPWDELESSVADVQGRYADRTFQVEDRAIHLDRAAVLRAAVKYGGAIAHVTRMARHLAAKGFPHDLEISVDETETPTTHAEHIYIASELKRLGVRWVSLAPRFVGRFEKGVDYISPDGKIGDVQALRADLDGHAAIARTMGPYKLSLHSGSDKFSVYPVIVAATRGLVHLKTAGTSYLEALRAVAQVNPALFRDILTFSREQYATDRATYHVSASVENVPVPILLPDAQLPGVLDQFDGRQVLHVTFGSGLARFGAAIKATLGAHEAEHYRALEQHFIRHLEPFAKR